jgi:hypothetical protein
VSDTVVLETSDATPLERTLQRPAVACGLFLALAVAFTWPLAVRLDAAVPAGVGDLWQNYWNFWWWKTCLIEGRGPYWTPYLFHPTGTPVVFHTHSPFNMLVALPVTWLAGPGAAYGFCVLLALWLSGFGAYLLAREVTGSSRGAVVAGVVFAYFPQHVDQTLEHLNLFSVQFLPLATLALLRLAANGSRRNVVALAAACALTALADWQLALLLVLLLAPLSLGVLRSTARPPAVLVRELAAATALAALLTLPFAWPLLRGMAAGASYQKPATNRGVDVAFLLKPQPQHPLLGSLTRDAYADRAYTGAGFVCYLGIAALALAALGLARRRRETRFWVAVFAVALLFALGRHPLWDGRLLEGVLLPFGALETVPVVRLLRVANRFLVLSSLALALLAAFGWISLRRRGDRRFLAALGLVVIDYLWLPYPLREDRVSPLYAWLRAQAAPGAVLDLPFGDGPVTVQNMRAQVAHGRPIAGGYISVPQTSSVRSTEAIPWLADLMGTSPPLRSALQRERLAALGFAVAVLHKDGRIPDAKFQTLRGELIRACGPPVREDDAIAIFDLTPER